MSTHHRHTALGNVELFYREAGKPDSPAVLLLHGFPSSSHMYRNLIPDLARHYRVIAPDLPGFGFTASPARGRFEYSYENLTDVIEHFVEKMALDRFALVVFDSGAPVGYRLACRRPERVVAIVTHNGNAYLEGLSESWRPVMEYWQTPTEAKRTALKGLLMLGTTKWMYTHGAHDVTLIAPESYTLDQALLDLPENDEIMLDLLLDFESNVRLYPEFQKYFRSHCPPMLVVWSENGTLYTPAGGNAYRKDNPQAEIHMLAAGHFGFETCGDKISALIESFLQRKSEPGWTNARWQ